MSNYCKIKEIGLDDEDKFPDSRFSHFKVYSHHGPEKLRLIPDLIRAWHTLDYDSGWAQVDLGELYLIYGLDIRGSCWCDETSMTDRYFTSTFKLLYSLQGLPMKNYSENGQEKVNMKAKTLTFEIIILSFIKLKILHGNVESNWNEILHIDLNETIVAEKVRFVPLTGNFGAISVELYGCGKYANLFFF